MSNEPTNIDELLHAGKTGVQPHAPENDFIEPDKAEEKADVVDEQTQEKVEDDAYSLKEEETTEPVKAEPEFDDYGNEKPAPRTFTEDEVHERINQAVRDRLSRVERNAGQQPQQAQVQQAAQQGFEYNAESSESWQQQLESFVENTIQRMSQKQAHQAYQQREQQAQMEFEQKFRSGMDKFKDYVQVVGAQPITDSMTLASRGMKDPAAFFYAASKRAPQELQRIAQIQDQVTQMVEIGKLDERMRQAKPTSKTPKPLNKVAEDSSIPHKSSKQPSIEELIAKDEAKRKAAQNKQRR